METKSKVKSINLKKEGTGQYGQYFVFTVSFENGDSGDYMAKTNPQKAFIIDQEAEYTKETKQNGNYTNTIIKPKQQDKGVKFQSPAGMNKRAALDAAIRLVAAGKAGDMKTLDLANIFNKWLNE